MGPKYRQLDLVTCNDASFSLVAKRYGLSSSQAVLGDGNAAVSPKLTKSPFAQSPCGWKAYLEPQAVQAEPSSCPLHSQRETGGDPRLVPDHQEGANQCEMAVLFLFNCLVTKPTGMCVAE